MDNVIHIGYGTLQGLPEVGEVWLIDPVTKEVMGKFIDGNLQTPTVVAIGNADEPTLSLAA